MRPTLASALSLGGVLAVSACGSKAFPTTSCKDATTADCVEVDPEDPSVDLQDVVNSLTGDTTIVLGVGTFALDNQVTFRGSDDIALVGQGMDETLLDFGGMTVQANGVDAIADNFLIQDLTLQDAVKDGLRVEDSSDVTIRRVRATWTTPASPDNGGYGLYPVRVERVLLEDSEAFHASDAGVYVGQCVEAIVRNNLARGNVAGLEIENTQHADVYGNTVEGNTGGLVVFDLPGNPVVGRDIRIHDNVIRDNNLPNFAPGGTVAQIPAGTGTFAMASRRVEITGNTYANNDTVDVALISGLVVEGDPTAWVIPKADLVGSVEGLALDEDEDNVYNFRTTEIAVHGNTYSGSGTNPDRSDQDARPLGFLLSFLWRTDPVDTVVYDGVGESSFDPRDGALVSNDHHVCVGADTPSMATLNLDSLDDVPLIDDVYRPASPFAPYDCSGFTGGDLVMPTFAE